MQPENETMPCSAKEFRGGRGYRVTEVPGRRMPWRVHLDGQSPSSPLAYAFETAGDATFALNRLRKPVQSVAASFTLQPKGGMQV